ncbi:hypothetical protein [Maribacter sp. 2-571]|uniref:hypothetical protein n=1 Tax=Maribacter sp. 2-571 TaxID=3417569 RepID=UPI003D34D7AF
MNEILRIIEKRDLYTHIILFKIYIENEGRTDNFYGGQLDKEIQSLLGENFNRNDLGTAKEYLMSQGLTKLSCKQLTTYGRSYIEDWARSFENLSESDKQELQQELPTEVFDFFKFAEKAKTVLSFITQILKLKETLGN